jgi:hypothetical protein
MTANTIEVKRLLAIVEQKKAELESARLNLKEARKKIWVLIPRDKLLEVCRAWELKQPHWQNRKLYILAPKDWADGAFDFAAYAEAGENKVCIGGYWGYQHDRFRQDVTEVYIQEEDYAVVKDVLELQPA